MDSESWTAWGDAQPELPRSARSMLKTALGPLTARSPVPISRAVLPESGLSEEAGARLADALGADGVVTDDVTRARHAGGQSYVDLIRRRRGDAREAPDAVLYPASAEAVADVLRICSLAHIAVVPWGGGTSVVGGLSALRGDCVAVVALDLARLDRLLDVDHESLTATFEPGIRTPAAEAALAAQGLTLGHVPQSYERASLGGYVVTRSAGQASSGIGRIDDLLVGCRLQTPRGEITLPALPASAAGPDLRRLVLGSEGTLGVVTELTLRVRPLPEATRYEAWTARGWETGLRIVRQLGQVGPKPDVLRLSDPDETQVSLALSGTAGAKRRALDGWLRMRGVQESCLIIVGFQGTSRDVRHRRHEVRRRLRTERAVALGRGGGESWERHRFAGPYLRDTLLDAGVLAETLETAATWTRLPKVYAGVTRALSDSLQHDGKPPLVGCHVSHVYPTGASLYFTALARAEQGREIKQWSAAKHAANDAIVAAGGTASHHHAVGTAHRDIVVTDLGGTDGVGVEALRAMKAYLDPAGILNPGKLLPDPAG
jgi:alkyldihydroxyacetonephosphate synthase